MKKSYCYYLFPEDFCNPERAIAIFNRMGWEYTKVKEIHGEPLLPGQSFAWKIELPTEDEANLFLFIFEYFIC